MVMNISKVIEPITFIFGAGLPSEPAMKCFDFETNRPVVRVGLGGGGGREFWPNDKI